MQQFLRWTSVRPVSWFGQRFKVSTIVRFSALAVVLGCTLPVVSRADYATGLQAYASADYARAIQEWSVPELAEHPQTLFGVMHMRGLGVEQDRAKAVSYYLTSAELGFSSAQFNLGLAYYGGKGVGRDAEKTRYWWQQAAERGHAVAQYNLAAILWSGDGVAQDQALAMHWFREAKSNGSEDATNFLLTLFEPMYRELTVDTLERVRGDSRRTIPLIDEFGLYKLGLQAMEKQQFAQAFGYWEPLAKDGHVESQYQIARLYEAGQGVESNLDSALYWYDRAAQKGHGASQFRLGLYHMNESPDPNKALGFYWIQSAADNGDAEAQAYIDAQ